MTGLNEIENVYGETVEFMIISSFTDREQKIV